MRRFFASAAVVLPCFACGAAAPAAAPEPNDLLKPLAYLAGHCWKGATADGGLADEHCFSWLYGARVLRDLHTARTPGQPDSVGETTYYANSAGNRVEYLDVDDRGGFSRGTVESLPGSLIFPDAQSISDGEATVRRARWTPQGGDAYETWSEAQTADGWSTTFKLTMKRAD